MAKLRCTLADEEMIMRKKLHLRQERTVTTVQNWNETGFCRVFCLVGPTFAWPWKKEEN